MELEHIRRIISEHEAWIIQTRREFHQHPELGMEEYWTAQHISGLLQKMGIPHQTGIANTGIVGLIEGGRPGKTVALHADMDALPITEATGLPFASIYSGKMHACGHDAHLAILLGTAKVLQFLAKDFNGNIKLLFQPAEEAAGGAKPMIEAGCMENPRVDYVLGLHVTPQAEAGQILLRRGKISASSDDLKITVYGRSAHAAYPEEGVDAILLAAQVVIALQTVISRNLSPLESGVISLGKINGGVKENVLADRVVLSGTIRTLTPKVRNWIKEKIKILASGICESMGGSCSVEFNEGYMPIINSDYVISVVEANAQAALGKENVLYKENPSLGVEDFAYFADYAPGAFYYLGAGNQRQGISYPGHSPQFQIDEACLKTGVLLQVNNALSLLEDTESLNSI